MEFFSEKKKFNLCLIAFGSFHLGGCVDEVVNNRANYQGYERDVYFL